MNCSQNKPGPKVRLDNYLVSAGLVESRSRAQAILMAGKVFVDGERITRAGHKVRGGEDIKIKVPDHPYVSRGGLKLEAALKELPVDFSGLHVMDVGASTGGFTDCLLQHGARSVIAVDVGYGQLHWKLRKDPRVTVLERTNIRYLEQDVLGEVPQGAVIDVSFISLRLVLPVTLRLLAECAQLVVLVKPQFELEREAVGKKGVVRDEKDHERAVQQVLDVAQNEGLEILGWIPSPVMGPKGNKEFLVGAKRGA